LSGEPHQQAQDSTQAQGTHEEVPETAGNNWKFRDIKVEDKDTAGVTGRNHQIRKQCILNYISLYKQLSVEINKFNKVKNSGVL